MLLLFYPQKSHRCLPMIVCKGTKKQAQYKTKCEVFSILAYKYAAFIRVYLYHVRKISYEIFAYIIDYQ